MTRRTPATPTDPTDPAQVPAPHLDPARRASLLQAVLADPAPGRRTRPWVVPLAAAASVGVIAGLGVAVLGGGVDRGEDEPPAATDPTTPASTTPDPAPVPFTMGSLDAAAAQSLLSRCADEMDLASADLEVVYAQRFRADGRRHGAVLGRDDATGLELFCDSEGSASRIAGPGSKSVVVPPTADRPLTSSGVGHTSYSTPRATGPIAHLRTAEGFRVAEHVARVEMRVGTKAAPGMWYSATPDRGFAYLAADLGPDVPLRASLFVEVRAFDADGKPVTGPAPLGRQPLGLGLHLRGLLSPGTSPTGR